MDKDNGLNFDLPIDDIISRQELRTRIDEAIKTMPEKVIFREIIVDSKLTRREVKKVMRLFKNLRSFGCPVFQTGIWAKIDHYKDRIIISLIIMLFALLGLDHFGVV